MSYKKSFTPLIPLLMLVIIDTMGIGLIFPVLTPLFMLPSSHIVSPHTSLIEREFLYSLNLFLFSLFSFIATPVLGNLSDHFGRKRLLLFCLLGTAVSSIFCAVAIDINNLVILFLGRILAGLTAGSQSIAQAAIIDFSSKEAKTKNLGLIALANCLGFIIGPALSGFFSDNDIVSWFDYSTPFYVNAALAFLNAGLLIYSLKEIFIPKKTLDFNLTQNLQIFTQAIRNSNVRLLCLVVVLYETAWALYFQYISIFLVHKFNYGTEQIGLFMTYLGVILAVTFLVLIRLLLRAFTEFRIAQLSLLMSSISIILLVFFHSLIANWLLNIPLVIGIGLISNTLLTLFSNSVTEAQQGWVMGVSAAAMSIAWVFGSLLVGILGSVSAVFPFICASLLMLSSYCTLSLIRFKGVKSSIDI